MNTDAPVDLARYGEDGFGAATVERFVREKQVGEGTFGDVFKARDKATGESVALKKIRTENEKEGFPITALREIRCLKQCLGHPNVVTLKEVVTSRLADYNAGRGNVYLVFEYMDHDLHGLLSSNHQHAFTLPQVKCYMRQLLEGLHHLHKMKLIIHRDLKGSNLLVNNKGELKITDFGMSRFYNKNPELRDYTTRVVTVWFRAPELLFGDEKYGPAVDIWSAGCILAELLTRKPLFTGADELRVMDRITEVCGTPTNEVWPDVQQLKHYNILIGSNPLRPDQLDEELQRRKCDPIGAALLKKMLIFNPEKRIIAEDALHDDFFWKEPLPCTPKEMPIFPSAHEFEVRREKSAQQAARKKQRV